METHVSVKSLCYDVCPHVTLTAPIYVRELDVHYHVSMILSSFDEHAARDHTQKGHAVEALHFF
jgi:hypothetical protein